MCRLIKHSTLAKKSPSVIISPQPRRAKRGQTVFSRATVGVLMRQTRLSRGATRVTSYYTPSSRARPAIKRLRPRGQKKQEGKKTDSSSSGGKAGVCKRPLLRGDKKNAWRHRAVTLLPVAAMIRIYTYLVLVKKSPGHRIYEAAALPRAEVSATLLAGMVGFIQISLLVFDDFKDEPSLDDDGLSLCGFTVIFGDRIIGAAPRSFRWIIRISAVSRTEVLNFLMP